MDRDCTGLQQRGLVGPILGPVGRKHGIRALQHAPSYPLGSLSCDDTGPINRFGHPVALESLERFRDRQDGNGSPVGEGCLSYRSNQRRGHEGPGRVMDEDHRVI